MSKKFTFMYTALYTEFSVIIHNCYIFVEHLRQFWNRGLEGSIQWIFLIIFHICILTNK